MKPYDSLQHVYDDAPAGVLATMTVGALARGDTSEIARIGDALQNKARSASERRSQIQRRNELTQMGLAWALACWQTYGALVEFAMATQIPDDYKLPLVAGLMRRAMNAKLASLIAAQREICERNGMVFDDMARLANLDAMVLRDEAARPIPDLVKELVERYGV